MTFPTILSKMEFFLKTSIHISQSPQKNKLSIVVEIGKEIKIKKTYLNNLNDLRE